MLPRYQSAGSSIIKELEEYGEALRPESEFVKERMSHQITVESSGKQKGWKVKKRFDSEEKLLCKI